jgi:citrate lyase subunit beta/citryl-CoA lyase
VINTNLLKNARSLLSVPGHRPDRFNKAATSQADIILLDMEDSVGSDLKPQARDNIVQWLAQGGKGLVRVNAVGTKWHDDDVAAFSDEDNAVVLPKAESAEQIADLADRLTDGSFIFPTIETALGIINAVEICRHPKVLRPLFGNGDFGCQLGIDPAAHTELLYARSHVVTAAAAAGCAPPIDGVTIALHDDEQARVDSEHSAALGFGGKACIHPRQVPIVNAAFTPSAEEVAWARKALSALGDENVGTLDGIIIARAPLERARRILNQISVTE